MESVLKQNFDRSQYELLIIDGQSTDGTKEVVFEFSKCFPNVRYEVCLKPGLPQSRVLGAYQARGKFLGYLDDDAKACSDWLQRAWDIAAERSPICFGGPFAPFYLSGKPGWYRDAYGSMSHGDEARVLHDNEFLCGGNIFFLREALLEVGGFDADYWKTGERFSYGEEGVPQMRLREKFPNRPFYYDPHCAILHLVRPERLNLWRGVREGFEMGRGYSKLMAQGKREMRRFPFLWRMLHQALRFIGKILFLMPLRNRSLYPHWQNFLYENTAPEARAIGMFYESYRSVSSPKLRVGKS
jgi:glycosyltransferase involved in cell wall biosynthesis